MPLATPLFFKHVVQLRLRLGATCFKISFVVVDSLSCSLVLGIEFLNKQVDAIVCRERFIK